MTKFDWVEVYLANVGMNVTAGINIGDNLTSAVLTSAIISNGGNIIFLFRMPQKNLITKKYKSNAE